MVEELEGGRLPDGTGFSSLRDEAAKASSPKASIPSAAWLNDLRVQLEGSGSVTLCCHPDVEDEPASHPDRRCVLDHGRASDCDVALHDRVAVKADCHFWQTRKRTEPAPLSIEQALALVSFAQAIEAGTAATPKSDAVHESAVPTGCAKESPL